VDGRTEGSTREAMVDATVSRAVADITFAGFVAEGESGGVGARGSRQTIDCFNHYELKWDMVNWTFFDRLPIGIVNSANTRRMKRHHDY